MNYFAITDFQLPIADFVTAEGHMKSSLKQPSVENRKSAFGNRQSEMEELALSKRQLEMSSKC
jgi:hypothetical protein